MEKFSKEDYINNGCNLANPEIIFLGIYDLTNGHPCPGCAFESGCKTIETLDRLGKQRRQKCKIQSGETNQQFADRLGITKRQASKLRKAGKL
jgi:hypothetical protein